MAVEYSRVIPFENIPNFRDLGGYETGRGKTIAWRRLFRSGGLLRMTMRDKIRLIKEFHLKTVLDLRTPEEMEKIREVKLLQEIGVTYFNIPFRPDNPNYYRDEMKLYKTSTNMGEFYLRRINPPSFAGKLIQVLEILSEPGYFPALFHCGVGKDRTGMLAALLLNLLGVSDVDIIGDYVLSDVSMKEIRERIINEPQTPAEIKALPDFTWRALPEYMETFLYGLKNEYGSAADYLEKYGAEKILVRRLEKALLV